MTSAVILPKDIQISKLKYSDVKSLANGSKTVYINYGSDKLTLQTPLMHLPYGIGDWNDKSVIADKKSGKKDSILDGGDDDKIKKYDLSVSFAGMAENPKLKSLHDQMLEIEKKIKQDAYDNRLAWLRDDYDGIKNITDKLFNPIIKLDKDKETGKVVGKYPPTMKLKLPYDNNTNEFTFDCHDMDKNELDFKAIMTKLKGGKAQMIIQLTGLWFAGGRYGCTWKVLRAKFQLPNKSNYDYVEDSDDENPKSKNMEYDEDLEEDALAMGKVVTPPSKKLGKITLKDDDDDDDEVDELIKRASSPEPKNQVDESEQEEEEEEEEEESPPPPPVKKPTKKTTVKK
jgi:hypothetical protein